MFGRKKNKEEKRDKKKHKHGMTPAEISQLQEVGIRRGFFSKRSGSKREKEEQKSDTTSLGSDQQNEDVSSSSVLERATAFGNTVQRKTSSSRFPPPMPHHVEEQLTSDHPVPPQRRKPSHSGEKKHKYDVPRPVPAARHTYDVPHSWKDANSSPQTSPVHTDGPLRKVTLVKRASGDFGVSLRRSVMLIKDVKKTIYFAEPGGAMYADSHPGGDNSSRLLPGDRLVEINGKNVEDAAREDIVMLIKKAGDQVTFVVQSTSTKPEKSAKRSNLNGERPASILNGAFQAKDDTAPKLPAAKKVKVLEPMIPIEAIPGVNWNKKQKIWFLNDNKLCAGHFVECSGDTSKFPELVDGRKFILLEDGTKPVMVHEEKVELANEPEFDRTGDISTLRHLNDYCMIHTLGHRLKGSLHQSFAGSYLISMASSQPQQNIFNTKTMETYKGSRLGDVPPHVFAIAQHAHNKMLSTHGDQCIINLGRSGSGKSQNLHQILKYLATTTVTSHSNLTVEKFQSVLHIMESFTSCATNQCKNSSRCVCLYNLDFDRTGQMVAASVQTMLLERNRLFERSEDETSFNIFHRLLHGASTSLRKELFLVDFQTDNNPILKKSSSEISSVENIIKSFDILQQSFESLMFKADEIKAIFNILAACLHLAVSGSVKASADRYQFSNVESAQKASSLLGVPVEKLSKIIFQQPRVQGSASSLSPNVVAKNLHNAKFVSGEVCLQVFVMSLYSELCSTVVSLVNRSLSSTHHAQNTIMLLDTPGYKQTKNGGSSFHDLMYNYVQDCLHVLLHNNSFIRPRDSYEQEGISNEIFIPDDGFSSSVEMIDRPPVLGASDAGKGLLWILDEEISQNSSVETFLDKILEPSSQENGNAVIKPSEKPFHFYIQHQAGYSQVEYDATNWFNLSKFKVMETLVLETMQESKKKYIQELFGANEKMFGSVAGLRLDGGNTLKRATSFRNAWTTSSGLAVAVVKKSSCMLLKRQVDGLIDVLKRSQPHFILSCAVEFVGNNELDCLSLQKQLQGFQLLHIARSIKQGYPESVALFDFRSRFDVLLRHLSHDLPSNSTSVALMDDKEATEKILEALELNRSQYRLGNSQVFFRFGVLNRIEDKRNQKISSVLTLFQARCRGYLARRKLERRKVQVVAVRCIQRNIRKFMAIRQWPWWRLLTKVLPLVEVVRTEEELQEVQAELSNLKEKYEKVMKENNDFKTSNAKYETKLQEVIVHLDDERATCTHATELLEHETKEKNKLEKQLKESQQVQNSMRTKLEGLEVEVAEKRLLYADHHNISDSDEELEDGEYKAKYERACREFKFKSNQQKQEFEDSLDELQTKNKLLEKKIHQVLEEVDEHQRGENQGRKKIQRLQAELSDAQIHLEETNHKNFELEKKQRKFDSELYSLQADVTDLKVAKDKVLREKDKLHLEKNSIEKDFLDKSEEVEMLQKKIQRLEEELEDESEKDSDDRRQINVLKKQIRELNAKISDQEEELEEQATTIHTLEQTKERLEMSSEQSRQQRMREVDSKEEELEEMRSSYQKKIKQLENQLDEVEEERASIYKQRVELEQELNNFKQTKFQAQDSEAGKRLRRDLKRYKALLADAQTMIDHLKADVVSKQQMRQLKAQLEESEYSCSAAVKSRKAIELELDDIQSQLDEVSKAKQDAESQLSSLQREVHELRSKMEDDAEDSHETIRKYKNLVATHTEQQAALVEVQGNVEELKHEKATLQEKIVVLQSQIQYFEDNMTDKGTFQRLDSKAKDLDTKLEFQKTANRRLEVQLSRVKDNLEKVMTERDSHKASEVRERELAKQYQRQLRESKNEQGDLVKREQEALKKKHDLQMELDESQNQIACLQADLKLAFRRINDLQMSLEDLEESDVDDESGSESDVDDEEEVFSSFRYGGRSQLSSGSRTSSSRSYADYEYRKPSFSDKEDLS